MKILGGGETLSYAIEKCGGCGRCVEVCPHRVFVLEKNEGKTKAQLVRREFCIECGACAKNCESEAIQVTAGVGCATALFYSLRTGKPPCC